MSTKKGQKQRKENIHAFPRKTGVDVICKCPKCGVLHKVKMTTKPFIMPRIYCPKHDYLRHDSGECFGCVEVCRPKEKGR